MPYIESIRALIAEKETEISRLEAELTAAHAYVTLLDERLEEASKRVADLPATDDPIIAVRRVLLQSGRPLFIDEIIHGLGQTVSSGSREDLRRLLLPWVRRNEVFSRPRPATFGLVEWDEQQKLAGSGGRR